MEANHALCLRDEVNGHLQPFGFYLHVIEEPSFLVILRNNPLALGIQNEKKERKDVTPHGG